MSLSVMIVASSVELDDAVDVVVAVLVAGGVGVMTS